MNNVAIAFALTAFAGLATGIGSLIALFARHTNRRFLSFALGFSAGVMIYVSFMELVFSARTALRGISGETAGDITAALSFFGGIAIAALIDKMVPAVDNPHEMRSVEAMDTPASSRAKAGHLSRMGLMTALALAIHNFPEGIATFMSAVGDPEVGLAIAVAVAIHNIPEGIAVSVPIYYATGNRKKAFWYSFLSGAAEPLGAVTAYLLLAPFMTPVMLHCTFAAVGGIMVYISLDELLPAAREYGEAHISIYGLIAGMAVMAASLILLM